MDIFFPADLIQEWPPNSPVRGLVAFFVVDAKCSDDIRRILVCSARIGLWAAPWTLRPDRSVAGLTVNAGPPAVAVASEFERCVVASHFSLGQKLRSLTLRHFGDQADGQRSHL